MVPETGIMNLHWIEHSSIWRKYQITVTPIIQPTGAKMASKSMAVVYSMVVMW